MPNTFDNLDLLIYLDENLMTGLNSMVLNGVIQSRTIRRSSDKGLSARAHMDNRESSNYEHRNEKQSNLATKIKRKNRNNSYNFTNDNGTSLEDRFGERFEESLTTITTSFNMHSDLRLSLLNSGMLKSLTEKDILNCNVTYGDYVEVSGILTQICITPYIDTLISLFNCHTTETLNKFITDKNPGLLNYSSICMMLENIKKLICSGGTQDLVIMCGQTPLIIPSSLSYFINNAHSTPLNPNIQCGPNCYIFDKVPCKCKIFGKVLSYCKKNEKLSLLRKCGQSQFYEDFMASLKPYLDILIENNIILPSPHPLQFSGPSLLLLPISICI